MNTVVVRFADADAAADAAAYYIATADFIGVSRRTRRSDAASDAVSCVNETNKISIIVVPTPVCILNYLYPINSMVSGVLLPSCLPPPNQDHTIRLHSMINNQQHTFPSQ
ncbi:hypothetical protein YC2023_120685 [Brassica napus]